MDGRTYQEALADLDRIVQRYTKDIENLTHGPTDRGREKLAAKLTVQRDAVAAALAELTHEVLFADTADVPPAVAELVDWMIATLSESGAAVPVHPHAGWRADRHAAGGVGHCWACATVGHQVAHPERTPAAVGCTADHSELDNVQSPPAEPSGPVTPPAGPPTTPPPVSPGAPAFLPPVDLSQPPSGPM